MLVEWWVRIGTHGAPGLMFWRNEPVTKLLLAWNKREPTSLPNLGLDFIKDLRKKLGLIPVGDKVHLIWDMTINAQSDGGWQLKGVQRDGNPIFQTVIKP